MNMIALSSIVLFRATSRAYAVWAPPTRCCRKHPPRCSSSLQLPCPCPPVVSVPVLHHLSRVDRPVPSLKHPLAGLWKGHCGRHGVQVMVVTYDFSGPAARIVATKVQRGFLRVLLHTPTTLAWPPLVLVPKSHTASRRAGFVSAAVYTAVLRCYAADTHVRRDVRKGVTTCSLSGAVAPAR